MLLMYNFKASGHARAGTSGGFHVLRISSLSLVLLSS